MALVYEQIDFFTCFAFPYGNFDVKRIHSTNAMGLFSPTLFISYKVELKRVHVNLMAQFLQDLLHTISVAD